MKRIWLMTLSAAAVAGLSLVSLLSRGDAIVAAIWPANAVVLALSLRTLSTGRERSLALAIAGTAFVVTSLIGGRDLVLALGFSVANLVEIALAMAILRGCSFPDERKGDYTRLLAGAVAAGPAASTVVAAITLMLDGRLAGVDDQALQWFCSDAVSMGVCAPLLLTLRLRPSDWRFFQGDDTRMASALIMILAVDLMVFSQSLLPLLFLISPFVVFAVFAGGGAGGAIAVAITALVGVIATSAGYGPISLVHGSNAIKTLVLEGFLAAQALTVPPIASALNRMREAENRHRNLAEQAQLAESIVGLGHWRWDAASQQMSWSPEMPLIYGLDPDAPFGLEIAISLTHPEDQADRRYRMAEVLQGREISGASMFRIVRPSGEVRWLKSNVRPQFREDRTLEAVIGVLIDVTEETVALRKLKDSEARYRLLADSAQDIVMESDLAGVLSYVSPSVERIAGFAPNELIGRISLDIIDPEDAKIVRQAVSAQVASRGAVAPSRVEYRARTKDGRQIWLQAQPTLVIDPASGRMCGVTDIIRDVTERKQLEAELVAAKDTAEEAARVKAEFLSNMSHELRTPLTSIIGFTGLALGREELKEPARAYVQRVKTASDALLCLVNDVLDFSKLEAGQVEFHTQPTSLRDLCVSALELFAPQAGAKDLGLELKLDPASDRTLIIDPDRVRQVMINLIGNAVKFTPSGSITLEASYDGARLSIRICDTGPGIAPEKLDRLFKRFSQVDASSTRVHGGTGLGLVICKALVEGMKGEIGVESRLGEGAVFWFELPAQAAAVSLPASHHQALGQADAISGLRVLLVDDHPPNRELARLVLCGAGAEVFEACDGGEAVAMSARRPFDVVLMDLNMPTMDGRTALAHIRATSGPNDRTPILAFTANGEGDPERFVAMGFDGLADKPIDPAGLLQAVVQAAMLEDFLEEDFRDAG